MALLRSESPIRAPTRLSAVSPRLPSKQCQYLVEHRSFSTSERGMSAASFLHSSFLQAINIVMLWPVHVQKVPQTPEYLCPTKLQTRCDICCACQSICRFIPTDSGVLKASPRTKLNADSFACLPLVIRIWVTLTSQQAIANQPG